MIENIKAAEVADGWLVLDFNSETNSFDLSLEYNDGENLELESFSKEEKARKAFKKEFKKLK